MASAFVVWVVQGEIILALGAAVKGAMMLIAWGLSAALPEQWSPWLRQPFGAALWRLMLLLSVVIAATWSRPDPPTDSSSTASGPRHSECANYTADRMVAYHYRIQLDHFVEIQPEIYASTEPFCSHYLELCTMIEAIASDSLALRDKDMLRWIEAARGDGTNPEKPASVIRQRATNIGLRQGSCQARVESLQEVSWAILEQIERVGGEIRHEQQRRAKWTRVLAAGDTSSFAAGLDAEELDTALMRLNEAELDMRMMHEPFSNATKMCMLDEVQSMVHAWEDTVRRVASAPREGKTQLLLELQHNRTDWTICNAR